MSGQASAIGPLSLGMVAGEASGDLLAAALLEGVAARVGQLHAAGIGGPAMARHGFDAWWTIEALSVNGYLEVLREYPRLRRMRDALAERLAAWRPQVFVGVDAPDFNLDLEARLRRDGIRIVHFISPSIWAWRGEPIHKIRRAGDRVLALVVAEWLLEAFPNADEGELAVPDLEATQLRAQVRRGALELLYPAGFGAHREQALVQAQDEDGLRVTVRRLEQGHLRRAGHITDTDAAVAFRQADGHHIDA